MKAVAAILTRLLAPFGLASSSLDTAASPAVSVARPLPFHRLMTSPALKRAGGGEVDAGEARAPPSRCRKH